MAKKTPVVRLSHVNQAINTLGDFSLQTGAAMGDKLFKEQPNLLAGILVLSKFGVPMEKITIALKVLMYCYQATLESGKTMPQVTEGQFDLSTSRFTEKLSNSESLGQVSVMQAVDDHIKNHQEPQLIALAFYVLKNDDALEVDTEADKMFMLGSLSVVEVMAEALHWK